MERVAIIGGGLSGAWAAYLLAGDDREVVVYDDFLQPFRASEVNPGGINPLHGPQIPGRLESFQMLCHRLHFEHVRTICELSGLDYRLRVIDRLFAAFTDEDINELEGMQTLYDAADGFEAVWLDARQARFLEPRLSDRVVGGLLTRGNGVLDSREYNRALLAAARGRGARRRNINPDRLVQDGDRVTHVEVEGRREACDIVVIANGFRADEFFLQLGLKPAVTPLKGQMLMARISGAPFRWDITHGLTGLYQYRDNLYWLGGTRETPDDDPGPTAGGRGVIIDRIRAMLTGLDEIEVIGHHAGHRPGSPDGLPLVGLLPGYNNAYTITGSGSKGVLQCSGLAYSLVELLQGEHHPYPFLSPGRFTPA